MKRSQPASRASQSKPPAISDAEWVVMREFWQRGQPTTAAEIGESLGDRQQWKPGTILTLINRLVKKGALTFTKQGREHLYSPAVSEADCVHHESRSFVERMFDGKLAPLVACLVEREDLSDKDIAELRRILEKKS